jgi:3-hydroxyisobutyrate dehydrogenase-like beta-hydroxyacid dehydrogenase
MAVVGAGRMGSIVAEQLPGNTEKIIIDIDLEKARRLAEKVDGIPSDSLESTNKAEMVAVVLPTPVVNETVEKLLNVVQKETMILNMATTAHIDPSLFENNKGISIIDAKIIGQAMSISRGEPGIIVVKCDDNDKFDRIRKQLPGFHKVIQGEADRVEKINRIGSTEGIKAAMKVRSKLLKLDVPEEWIDVAIRTVCAGTMKSFTENDLGYFALQLVKKIESEMIKE